MPWQYLSISAISQLLLGDIIFVDQNVLGPNFFRPNFFGPEILLRPIFFYGPNFLTSNIIGPRNFFKRKSSLDTKLLQTKNNFTDQSFFCRPNIFFASKILYKIFRTKIHLGPKVFRPKFFCGSKFSKFPPTPNFCWTQYLIRTFT